MDNEKLLSLDVDVMTGRKTLIVSDGYYLAHAGENMMPMVQIYVSAPTFDTYYADYNFYLDFSYRNGEVASLPLTRNKCWLTASVPSSYIIPGKTLIQVRAINGELVWKSTVEEIDIRASINASKQLEPLSPTEFEIMEARIAAYASVAAESAEAAQNSMLTKADKALIVSVANTNGELSANCSYEDVIGALQNGRLVRCIYEGLEYRPWKSTISSEIFEAPIAGENGSGSLYVTFNANGTIEASSVTHLDTIGTLRVDRTETGLSHTYNQMREALAAGKIVYIVWNSNVFYPNESPESTDDWIDFYNTWIAGRRIVSRFYRVHPDNSFEINYADITVPENAGTDIGGLVLRDNTVYVKNSKGQIVGDGVDFPEQGVGFSSWYYEEVEDPDSPGGIKYYQHLVNEQGEDVIEPIELPITSVPGGGGGGTDTGSTVILRNRLASRVFTASNTNNEINIDYSVTSTDNTDHSPTGNVSETWSVGGSVVLRRTVAQGDNSFNIKQYLPSGATSTVKLTVEDAYGSTKSMVWTVTVTAYSISWNLVEMEKHGNGALPISLIPNGQGDKTLHIQIDGVEMEGYPVIVSTTARAVNDTIPAQAHGAHEIIAWFDVTVDGSTVSSEVLRHVGIWTVTGNNMPVVAFYEAELRARQYDTIPVKWMAVTPGSDTSTVNLKVNGAQSNIVTVGQAMQTWFYRASSMGTITLAITSGTQTDSISVEVEGTGVDIEPVTSGLVMDIDPAGHSNNESGFDNFGYKDDSGAVHPFTFSPNFDWKNGGFQQDEEGITAFVVKCGTAVETDLSFFADDAKLRGKEIKLIFKSKEVRDYDADMLTCVSGDVGLKLQAQQAILSSSNEVINIPYCEEKKIELDINIEPTTKNRLCTCWLKGVPSRVFAYSASDTWQQGAAAPVRIAPTKCDVWIYRVKMYSTDLERYDIMANYIADCADVDEMLERYDRNNIYNADGSTINIQALAEACPDLRIIKVSAERMTTAKTDEVPCNVELIHTNGGTEHSFTSTGVTMKAQGTSSAAYGAAALNLDLDFKNATMWKNGNGEDITKFAMTENSIGVNYFNVKLNVASSENANNACIADDYNTFQPYLNAARRANPKVRDTVEAHPCVVFFTNTSGATVAVGARSCAPGETMMYGIGDMNNSKKNYDVFGQDNALYPEQCCVEVNNNTQLACRFKAQVSDTETWDDDGDFQFRYPKIPTLANKTAFRTMQAWVVSTDPMAATGAAITSVIYGGVTYSKDTAAYRKAKFKAEFENYFSLNSMLYHLLFVERHCMTDNLAKNTFLTYEPDPDHNNEYRWNITKDYDNDTAEGNDNSGGLTFSYGYEMGDHVGYEDSAANVFNADDSVLWNNLRDCYSDELRELFLKLESAGAWKADRIIQKFNDYQHARPEVLYIEDFYGKYIAPYLASAETRYMGMAYGTKEDQREQFERYQEVYYATKYFSSLASDDRAEFRANTPSAWAGVTPSGDISITPYAAMYLNAKWGSYSVKQRAVSRGTPVMLECPISRLGDTETYVYMSSKISELGNLAGLYTKLADISKASKLQRLELGSAVDGYYNSSLGSSGGNRVSFGANPLLDYIDIRGAVNMNQSLDLTNLKSLKTLLASNTAVTAVLFADGAPIETAILPAVKNIKAVGIKPTTFVMSGSGLTKIWVEDCTGIDTQALVAAATNLEYGRINNIDWSFTDPDVMLRLVSVGGLDAEGKNTAHIVLSGKCYITGLSQLELNTLTTAFPNVTFSYGSILASHTVIFKNYDGTTLNTQSIRHGAAAKNPVVAGIIDAPTKPSTANYNYTFVGWDKLFNEVLSDLTVTATFSTSDRSYTVKWFDGSGNEMTQYRKVVVYGADATYDGPELPDNGSDLFMGWDKLTTNVTEDLDVHPLYLSGSQPSVKPAIYDYLYSDDDADNSAYTLDEFYWIVLNNRGADYFDVGDKVKIVMPSGTSAITDHTIEFEVYGFNHFELADDSGELASTVFGMCELLNVAHSMNSTNTNAGGWPASAMRNWLNQTIFNALPVQWRKMIKQVKVRSTAGGTSSDIVTSVDKLFLFSYAEVGLSTSSPYTEEILPSVWNGVSTRCAFSIFTDNASRIKHLGSAAGTASIWWLRSPLYSRELHFHVATTAGDGSLGYNDGNGQASQARGVAFGFCI